ncbi:UNVERIFIED_CONTAM: Epoxide hydrolase 1, partial [Eudyptes robustus]
NGYYGTGNPKQDDTSIKPFKIQVADKEIQDLKERLKNARIGHEQLEDVPNFEYGFPLTTLKQWREYWLNKYDWRKHEAQLNAFPQFITQIEGLKIHFIHAKPPAGYKTVVPLLLAHGWPGNVYEFYKIIPMLTDPKKHGLGDQVAFEVVAPSMPGYGWSEASHKKGLSVFVVSRIFKKLMTDRLKFPKFLVQGGDWGSAVASTLGKLYPESLIGVHINMVMSNNKPVNLLKQILGSYYPSLFFEDPHFSDFSFKNQFFFIVKESGYMHIQATKPDTVGVSLNDSPLGLLAYIGEKFSTWTNAKFVQEKDGGLEKYFTKDEVLTIISIYWFNQNILASQRLYKESFASQDYLDLQSAYCSAPTGVAHFPHDLVRAPKELLYSSYNLTHYTYLEDGGHFAAFQLPKVLAADVFKFINSRL